MLVPIDYVSERRATVRQEVNGARFLCGDENAICVGRTPSEVTAAVNRAMEVAVEYFAANVARSSTRISAALIRDASLPVVVYCLYGCSVQHEKLEIVAADLESMFARGCLLWFCEKAFGADHRDFSAALMGLSASEFAQWEEGWKRYCDK